MIESSKIKISGIRTHETHVRSPVVLYVYVLVC